MKWLLEKALRIVITPHKRSNLPEDMTIKQPQNTQSTNCYRYREISEKSIILMKDFSTALSIMYRS